MTYLYIILAILVLEFLIFIHELGHFAAGKLLGFRVLGFSLGFGPAIFKKKMGEPSMLFEPSPLAARASSTVRMRRPRMILEGSTRTPFGSALSLSSRVRL